MINLPDVENEIANALTIINQTKTNDVSIQELAESFLNIITIIEPIIANYKSTVNSYESLKQDYEEKEKLIQQTETALSSYRIKMLEKDTTISALQSQNAELEEQIRKYTDIEDKPKQILSSIENTYNLNPKLNTLTQAKERYLEDQISSLWESVWKGNCSKSAIFDTLNIQFSGGQIEGEALIKEHKYEEILIKTLSTLNDMQKVNSQNHSIIPSPVGKMMAPLRTSLEDYVNGLKSDKTQRGVHSRRPPKPVNKEIKKSNCSVQLSDPSWLFEHGLRNYDKPMTPSKVYNNFTKKTSGLFDSNIYYTCDAPECESCKCKSKR